MFLHRNISFRIILLFAWKVQLYAFCISALVYLLYADFGITAIAIPFLPVATIGTAVAFYVGFKNNSAYDRLWEARRIWGSITNASRMWAAMANDVVASRHPDEVGVAAMRKKLLYQHLAWLHLLRLQLRRNPVFNEPGYTGSAQLRIIRRLHGEQSFEPMAEDILRQYVAADEAALVRNKFNMAAFLLQLQNSALIECKNKGWLDSLEHSEMSKLVLEFYNQQGASERIKSFPFPRQYANFSAVFVKIFIFLLPFAMINDLDKMSNGTAWLVIPFTMLIAWVFNVMEQVGDASENPFDNGINDVPLTAICRNIEIEYRETLKERNLPPRLQPVDGILM